MTCNDKYHDCVVTFCRECEGLIYWISCPTGGWWKHTAHPDDDHDGLADVPIHAEELI